MNDDDESQQMTKVPDRRGSINRPWEVDACEVQTNELTEAAEEVEIY